MTEHTFLGYRSKPIAWLLGLLTLAGVAYLIVQLAAYPHGMPGVPAGTALVYTLTGIFVSFLVWLAIMHARVLHANRHPPHADVGADLPVVEAKNAPADGGTDATDDAPDAEVEADEPEEEPCKDCTDEQECLAHCSECDEDYECDAHLRLRIGDAMIVVAYDARKVTYVLPKGRKYVSHRRLPDEDELRFVMRLMRDGELAETYEVLDIDEDDNPTWYFLIQEQAKDPT